MATTAAHPDAATAPREWGVLAEFRTPGQLLHAAEKVREAGYRRWDVYSPFPVHGMSEAMGLKPSRVSWLMGFAAAAGAGGAFALQYWTSAVDYQIVVDGKPLGAWEPFTPVVFELGVLFAGFAAVFGMLALNGLPKWFHPLFTKERFLRSSDDGLFIAIEADDPRFEPEETSRFLESVGGGNIELVTE